MENIAKKIEKAEYREKQNKIIIENGLYKNIELLDKIRVYDLEKYKEFEKKYNTNLKEIIKFKNRYENRRYRLIKRIKKMIELKNENEELKFCTWTIKNEYMKLDHKRILKEMYKNNMYCINVDYGANGRKHYHGIVVTTKKLEAWKYGNCKFETINTLNEHTLGKYILKLSYHALKCNTKFEKVIYSRINK